MSRHVVGVAEQDIGFPRSRGDEPDRLGPAEYQSMFSPLTRG